MHIEYDGQKYWLVINGLRASFHSTYGQAERVLNAMVRRLTAPSL